MPFIRTTTNVNLAVDQEKRLRAGTAELVRDILNKAMTGEMCRQHL